MQLLTFAAKAADSEFGSSQESMDIAEKAMRALAARGVDASTAFDAVTAANDNLKTKGLAALGVYIDTSNLKFGEGGEVLGTYNEKLNLHQKILEALKTVAGEVADGQDQIGDSMKRSEVALSDAWDKMKKGLGEPRRRDAAGDRQDLAVRRRARRSGEGQGRARRHRGPRRRGRRDRTGLCEYRRRGQRVPPEIRPGLGQAAG